jgi:hypothetical protein
MRLVAFSALLAACSSPRTFHCESDGECVRDGVPGRCEVNGFCSFPDVTCATGSRYGDHAPPDVRGTCIAAPINSTCDNAEQLDLGAPRDGTLRAAPMTIPLSCSSLATGEVFYAIDLAECSDLTVHAQADGGNLAAAVLSDCTTELGCADAHSSTETETVELDGRPPGRYEIAVAGVSYDGVFTVDAEIAPPPTNTNPGAAMALTVPAHLVQSLARANDVAACGTRTGGRDLFYTVTLPMPAITGDSWTLEASVVSQTSNDFAVSLSSIAGCTSASTGPAVFRALNGGTYVLAVDGPTDGSCGHFTLDVTATEAPGNDVCAPSRLKNDFVPIKDFYYSPATAVVQLDGAHDDYVGSCGGTGNDVVYFMNVPSQEHVRITATDPSIGSTAIPVVYVRPFATGCADSTEAPYNAFGSCVHDDPTQAIPQVHHDTACARSVASAVLDMPDLAAGDYLLVVDSDSNTAAFELTVERILPDGDLMGDAVPMTNCTKGMSTGCCNLGTTVNALTGNTSTCYSGTPRDVYRELVLPSGCGISGHFELVSAVAQDLEIDFSAGCDTLTPVCSSPTLDPTSGWYKATTPLAVAGRQPGPGCDVFVRVFGAQAQASFAVSWYNDDVITGSCP